MEEIIQILIFVGAMAIAVIGQNAKNKKKPMTASPQEVLEDIFPDIECQEEEAIVPPTPKPVSSHKKTSKKTPPSFVSNSSVSCKEPPKPNKKITLNSREKAKQAFIFSEIFNRKY